MQVALIITVSVLGGLLVLFLILRTVMGAVRGRMEQVIQERFKREEMLAATPSASFFGVESLGGRQVRGNGALVLTRDEIWFHRAAPAKEFRIPISDVVEVTLPRSFCGKSILRPLLCVRYKTEKGEDAIAWAVRQPERWKAAIEGVVRAEG